MGTSDLGICTLRSNESSLEDLARSFIENDTKTSQPYKVLRPKIRLGVAKWVRHIRLTHLTHFIARASWSPQPTKSFWFPLHNPRDGETGRPAPPSPVLARQKRASWAHQGKWARTHTHPTLGRVGEPTSWLVLAGWWVGPPKHANK